MHLLRGIPNRREVLSWGSFDLANQSFTLIINTLLFGLFIRDVVMPGDANASFVWSLMGAISLGAVALSGPILGAFADARACKKKILIGTGLLCSTLTISLSFLPSAATVGTPVALVLAFAIYVPANIAFNVGENFLASFLPEIATRKTMGRISALGWTMGYLGSLVLLIGLVIAAYIFGLTETHQFRPLLLFAGIWFAVMIIPTIFFLPEHRPEHAHAPSPHPLRDALRRFGDTVREASRFHDLRALLASFLIYGMGVQAIIFFAGLIASEDFGFGTGQFFVFSIIVTITGGISAMLTGSLQDRLGHKNTLIGYIALWSVVAGSLLLISVLRSQSVDPAAFPTWPVWMAGAGIGFALGGIGTATRAAVGALTPSHRTAEFFGLWGTTHKLAGVVGLPIFGWIRSQVGSAPSLAVLVTFFVTGGLLLWRLLDAERGARTAREVEQEFSANLMDLAATAGSEPMGTSALTAQLPDPADLARVQESVERAERDS